MKTEPSFAPHAWPLIEPVSDFEREPGPPSACCERIPPPLDTERTASIAGAAAIIAALEAECKSGAKACIALTRRLSSMQAENQRLRAMVDGFGHTVEALLNDNASHYTRSGAVRMLNAWRAATSTEPPSAA